MTTLTITALGHRGDGIAEIDGRRIFVPFTLPGETVDADVDGERGSLASILEPSPTRVEPVCPHFGTCGGCALQHVAADDYTGFKRDLVVATLAQSGIETDVLPLLDATGVGRRRATLHASTDSAGYMRARSHDLLDIDACPILVPALRQTAPRIARQIGALIGDCDVLLTAASNGLDVAVRTKKRLGTQRLVPLAQRLRLTRLSLNGETVFQLAQPLVAIGRSTLELPAGSFLQATAEAEEVLARLVLEGIGKAKSVADLFCGVGPFALRIAERSRVAAFDSDRPAVLALQQAVRRVQGLKPVDAKARDLFRDPLAPVEIEPFDVVVFDPPRAGAEAQARELARSKVKTIVAVSCDPATFARDAAILIAGGYRLDRVTPVDQFAFSTHVELVGVFHR